MTKHIREYAVMLDAHVHHHLAYVTMSASGVLLSARDWATQ